MKMQESGENYLETILILEKRNGTVRSIDIAHEMDFTKPSISRAMRILRENGYIDMERNGCIHLTQKGRDLAAGVYERHEILTLWLSTLGIDGKTAAADACRIEHVISPETFDKIKEWAKDARVKKD